MPRALALALALAGCPAPPPPPPPPPGVVVTELGDLSHDDDATAESEPTVAVTDDGHVLVAWMGTLVAPVNARASYRVSADRGATWSPIHVAPLVASDTGSGDVTAAVTPDGRFALAYLSFVLTDTRVRIAYVEIDGAGDVVLGPVDATASAPPRFHDQPNLVVTATGRRLIALYDAHLAADADSATVVAASDDGVQWSVHDAFRTTTSDAMQGGLCADAGRVYLVRGTHVDGAPFRLQTWDVHVSDDDGDTWSAPTSVSGDTPDLAWVAPRCLARGDELFTVYGVAASAGIDESELPFLDTLTLAHSVDRGATFEAVAASDAAAGDHFLGPMPVFDADGALELFYWAGTGTNDANGSLRLALDAAGSFGASDAARAPIVVNNARQGTARWLGEYYGVAHQGRDVYVAYPDNTAGFSHINFQRRSHP